MTGGLYSMGESILRLEKDLFDHFVIEGYEWLEVQAVVEI